LGTVISGPASNQGAGTVTIANDVFTVFISHKHEDHALAVVVKEAIQSLNKDLIDCFVSGVDITAGTDWRREIRSALARSHILLLLFTAPSKNWDWCLFETGLYTRFDRSEIRSVICLFNPVDASPSPLADLQGVPANADKVRALLDSLCRRTWEVSDDWRRGALAPDITSSKLQAAARAIADAFCRSGSASTYYPCHRLVLSLSESDDIAKGIPESAQVILGPNGTSGYTMSLFDLAGGSEPHTWGDLLRSIHATKAPWRRQLDAHFLDALDEKLFSPIEGRMLAGGTGRCQGRVYRPILYSIDRGPTVGRAPDGAAHADRRPRSVTIVFDPEPPAARETSNG
jgi:TIR domain